MKWSGTQNYPKSRRGFQCLGPCYDKGTHTNHPVTLKPITNPTHSFCPVTEWEHQDPITGRKNLFLIDFCFAHVEKALPVKDLERDFTLPKIDFSCEQFLSVFYEILSLRSCMTWVENNKHLPHLTVGRVVDCAWKAFGSKMVGRMPNDELVSYYTYLAKTRWLDDIYSAVGSQIEIVNGKASFTVNPSYDIRKNPSEKRSFLSDKVIDENEMAIFLQKFITHYAKEEVPSHSSLVKVKFVEHIRRKKST